MKDTIREKAIRTIRRAIETLAEPGQPVEPTRAAEVAEAGMKLALPCASVKVTLTRPGEPE